jgi:hypothetical protein
MISGSGFSGFIFIICGFTVLGSEVQGSGLSVGSCGSQASCGKHFFAQLSDLNGQIYINPEPLNVEPLNLMTEP